MANNDEFEDSGLDDWDSDFDDMDFMGEKPKDRSPAGIAKESIGESLKGAGKGTLVGMGNLVEKGLPETAGVTKNIVELGSSISSMKSELLDDLEPTIRTFKQVGNTLLPKAKSFIPNKLYSGLQERLTVGSGPTDAARDKQIERQASISDSISDVFLSQEEVRTAEKTEDRIDRFVDRKLDAGRHKTNVTLLDNIDRTLQQQFLFTQNTYTAYLKKSLELKYKHLFVAKDTLSIIKLLTKVTEGKLEEIKHNTGLPDIQKQRLSESFKETMRSRMGDTFSNFVGNFNKNLLGSFKTNVFDKAKNNLSNLASSLNMAVDMSDAMEGMGDDSPHMVSQGAGMGASLLAQKLMGSKAGGVLSKLAPTISSVEGKATGAKTKALLKLKDLQDSTDGGLKGFLLDLLPSFTNGLDLEDDSITNALEPVSFDNVTKKSIVEIIPGYLAKILKGVTDLVTGTDSEEQIYDITTRDFVSQSQLKQNILDKTIGDSTKRGRIVNNAINKLSGAKKVNSPDDTLSYEDNKKDVVKVLLNHAYHKELLNVDRLYDFATSEDSVKVSNEYIQSVMSGVRSPKTVATILIKSLINNGKTDKFSLEQINNQIIRQMEDDEYRSMLPSLLDDFGYKRHVGDLVKDNKVNHEAITQHQLNSINTDEQVRIHNDDNYKDLLINQRAGMEDLKAEALAKTSTIRNVFRRDPQEPPLNNKLTTIKKAEAIVEEAFVKDTPVAPTIDQPTSHKLTPNRTYLTQQHQVPPQSQIPSSAPITTSIDTTSITKAIESFKASFTQHSVGNNTTTQSKLDIIIEALALNNKNVELSTNKITELVKNKKEMFDMSKLNDHFATLKEYMQANTESLTNLNLGMFNLIGGEADTLKDKFGSIGAGAIRGTKSVSSKLGSAYTSLMETSLNTVSSIGSGVLNLGGKVADKGIPELGKLSNTLLSGGFGLANKGLGLYGDSIKGVGKLGKSILGSFGVGSRTTEQEPYVNVYLKDNVDPGNPILSKRQQQQGVMFQDGSNVEQTGDITEPVFDPETNEVLITQEDIEHGLVDINNKSIYAGGNSMGLGSKLLKGAGGLLSKGGGLLKSGMGMASGKLDDVLGIYKTMIGATIDAGKGALGFGKDFVMNKFGLNKETATWQKQVISRLDTIIKNIQHSTVEGDTDGDGDRDGSYKDLMDKRKVKQLAKSSPTITSGTRSTQQSGSSAALGALGVLSSSSKKNSEDAADGGGIIEEGLKTSAGMALFEGAKKFGKKLLPGSLVKGAGSMIGGAGGLMSSAASSIGAAAVGTLSAIPVAGWVALGVGAAGYGAYKLYQSFQPTEASDKLLRRRMLWYGIPDSVDVDTVRDLEERINDIVLGKKQLPDKAEYESLASGFGVDHNNPTAMRGFISWCNKCFIFKYTDLMAHLSDCAIDLEMLNDVEKDTQDFEEIDILTQMFISKYNRKLPSISLKDVIKSTPKKKPKKSSVPIMAPVGRVFKQQEPSTSAANPTTVAPKSTSSVRYSPRGITLGTTDQDIKKGNVDTLSGPLLEKTKDWIKGHEGLRLNNYKDSLGKDTIGFGHLNKEGYESLSLKQAENLFEKDFTKHFNEAKKLPEFDGVDPVRQAALLDLTYNLGLGKLLKFKKARARLSVGAYDEAGEEILDSNYASQVGKRAYEVANVIQSGNPDSIQPRPIPSYKNKESLTTKLNQPTVAVATKQPTSLPTNTSSSSSSSGYMQPNVTMETYAKTVTPKSSQVGEDLVLQHAQEQTAGIHSVGDKIDSLKMLLSDIFGTGEVFNEMNNKLQASIDKEPVIIENVTQEQLAVAQQTTVQQLNQQPRTSSPTINVHKTRYNMSGGV